MITDLTVFTLAHIGAFVIIRDLLETSGVRAIEDANGLTDETTANFAQAEGEYILPAEKCSYSETLNYVLFGKRLFGYAVEQIRSGRSTDQLKSVYSKVSSQVKTQLGYETEQVTNDSNPISITGD